MVSARIQCGCKSLEMSASLTLGIRLSPKCYERVKIESLNLDSKVEQLKLEASKATNLPKHFLVLIYCGNVLDDNATLRSCGLKSGCTVQVLRKKEKDRPASVRILTEADIQELIQAFKTFNRHPSYRSALNRLIRKEVLENIIMATPGLKNDPAAMALLKDPDLILQMENSDTVKRIVEKHPSLADAASHIAAVIHEEIANNGNSANPGTSSGFTYALDSLSDEEDMDSSQSSDSQPTGDSLSRQQSFSTITTSQLAAALASASGQPQVETQGDAGRPNVRRTRSRRRRRRPLLFRWRGARWQNRRGGSMQWMMWFGECVVHRQAYNCRRRVEYSVMVIGKYGDSSAVVMQFATCASQ